MKILEKLFGRKRAPARDEVVQQLGFDSRVSYLFGNVFPEFEKANSLASVFKEQFCIAAEKNREKICDRLKNALMYLFQNPDLFLATTPPEQKVDLEEFLASRDVKQCEDLDKKTSISKDTMLIASCGTYLARELEVLTVFDRDAERITEKIDELLLDCLNASKKGVLPKKAEKKSCSIVEDASALNIKEARKSLENLFYVVYSGMNNHLLYGANIDNSADPIIKKAILSERARCEKLTHTSDEAAEMYVDFVIKTKRDLASAFPLEQRLLLVDLPAIRATELHDEIVSAQQVLAYAKDIPSKKRALFVGEVLPVIFERHRKAHKTAIAKNALPMLIYSKKIAGTLFPEKTPLAVIGIETWKHITKISTGNMFDRLMLRAVMGSTYLPNLFQLLCEEIESDFMKGVAVTGFAEKYLELLNNADARGFILNKNNRSAILEANSELFDAMTDKKVKEFIAPENELLPEVLEILAHYPSRVVSLKKVFEYLPGHEKEVYSLFEQPDSLEGLANALILDTGFAREVLPILRNKGVSQVLQKMNAADHEFLSQIKQYLQEFSVLEKLLNQTQDVFLPVVQDALKTKGLTGLTSICEAKSVGVVAKAVLDIRELLEKNSTQAEYLNQLLGKSSETLNKDLKLIGAKIGDLGQVRIPLITAADRGSDAYEAIVHSLAQLPGQAIIGLSESLDAFAELVECASPDMQKTIIQKFCGTALPHDRETRRGYPKRLSQCIAELQKECASDIVYHIENASYLSAEVKDEFRIKAQVFGKSGPCSLSDKQKSILSAWLNYACIERYCGIAGDAVVTAVITGNYSVATVILQKMSENVSPVLLKSFADLYKKDSDFDTIAEQEWLDSVVKNAESSKGVIPSPSPEAVECNEESKYLAAIKTAGLDAKIVDAVLLGNKRFRGKNVILEEFLLKNTQRKLGGNADKQVLKKTIRELTDSGVLIKKADVYSITTKLDEISLSSSGKIDYEASQALRGRVNKLVYQQ